MNGIPWEDPAVGFPEDLGRTWIESLTAPVSFFRSMEPDAPLARAVLYFLIMAVGAALFSLLWGLAGSAPELPPVAPAKPVERELSSVSNSGDSHRGT